MWDLILQTAANAGVEPWNFSLADLAVMAEAADKARWRHTLLLYSGSMVQDRRAIAHYFPYRDENPVSKEAMRDSVKILRLKMNG